MDATGVDVPKYRCELSESGKEAIRQQIFSCDLSTDDREIGRKGTCSIYLKNEGQEPYKKLYDDKLDTMREAGQLEQCSNGGYFFIQYLCLMPESRISARQCLGLGLSCLAVFLYFFSVIYFDYIDTV